MLSQDKSAFIEQIEVTPGDKRAEKRRRRIAAARLQALQLSFEVRMSEELVTSLERSVGRVGDPRSRRLGRLHRGRDVVVTDRDVAAARTHLIRKQDELAGKQARVARLEQKAEKSSPPRRANRMFRLHSASHHIECSERRFAQWFVAQKREPVWVTTQNGRRWWWYADRFWWDDEGLRADDVRLLVFELDLEGQEQREAVEQLRSDVLRPHPPDSSV